MRKALPLKFFHVDDDYASTPGANNREATPLEIDFRPKRLILDPMNVSSFYAVNPELLKFPPISFEPCYTQDGQEQEKPRNWSLDMKWLNITGDVTSPFPKNRVLMKHELQKCYNVTFDEENIKETLTSRAVLDEHSKISENHKKMKSILDLNGSKNKLENKKKKIKEISFDPEDRVTAIFLHLSQQKKQIKKKLQTLPQFQHQRRKSCQSSWSGGLSKLEKKLETRIWNNDPHLPRQPHHHQKNFTISTIARSKINTKKKLINKLKARNQLIRKPSRTVVSNRATPAVEIHNGPASSAKLSSETELDTLSVTSRHNNTNKTPENGHKSHFRRYSQFQPNTKRSQEENGSNSGNGGGEPQSIKLGTDGSPLTGDKLGAQEESPFLRRNSRTVTETLAVVGSKEDFSPKVISIFGQNMQTPRQSGMIYSFQEGLDENVEEDNTSQKPHVKPAIILKKDDSNKNSKPQSPVFNQEDVVKELSNLKKDMKKVKGYLKHVKKRSFKKSKMTKSKLIQQDQLPEAIAQVVRTEPTAEIVITEPQEGPKTARSRRELTRIIATPKASSNSVAKVKNIYNNSLNFGLDLKWIDPKTSVPFKETSRSPLTSLSREPKSTQLTTTKIGSPYLMPSNPSVNSGSFLSIQKNEKSGVVNTKTLQDVVVTQKGLTERNKEEKKSSVNLQSGGLPQINNKPRPKIQIKAWDEGIMDRKNIPSGINSCSSRTISSMLANSKIIL